jgi:putative ABC transport system permease protein
LATLVLLAWRNLFRNPRRTAASLLTVALGAAGLLIYQGFNEGIMNQYRENTIRVRYGHGYVFPKGYYDKKTEEPWKTWISGREDVEKKLKATGQVIEVFPRLSFYAFLMKGGLTLAGRGEGILPNRERTFFTAMNFVSGGDLDGSGEGSDEIILGRGLAESLGLKVGDLVTVLGQTVHGQMNGLELTVRGIFHTGSKEFDDSFFRIDLGRAQNLLDTDRVEHFAIQTGGVEAWPAAHAAITAALPELDAKPFDDLDAVYYKNAVKFLESQFSFIRSIMLLIVALGIFNTIAVGLLERAGEVGALRANGESRGRLFRILLCESAFLGVAGGVVGIVIAVALDRLAFRNGIPMPPGPGITREFRIFLEIQGQHYLQALLLPAVTTVIASLIPIVRLVRKSIPELLRS